MWYTHLFLLSCIEIFYLGSQSPLSTFKLVTELKDKAGLEERRKQKEHDIEEELN